MARALGRAPSPYQPRAASRAAANNNTAVRSYGPPANYNKKSFAPPSSITKQISNKALRAAVPRFVSNRMLRLAARQGLRAIPYIGMAFTLYELLGLMMDILRQLSAATGGKYAGYTLTLQCGRRPMLMNRANSCASVEFGTQASMNATDAAVRLGIANGTEPRFGLYEVQPSSSSPGYFVGPHAQTWTRTPGVVNTAPVPGAWSPGAALNSALDALRQLDAVLATQVAGLVAPPMPVQPPAIDPDVPPAPGTRYEFLIRVGAPIGAPSRLPDRFPSSRPPPRGTKEGKTRTSGKMAAAIFRALDKVSEGAEVVNALFESLPCKVQKAAARRHLQSRGLLDNAGQYGIDGADWKAAAIVANYRDIDTVLALQKIAINEVEDRIIGSMSGHVRKVYKGPDNMLTGTAGKGVSDALAKLISRECS